MINSTLLFYKIGHLMFLCSENNVICNLLRFIGILCALNVVGSVYSCYLFYEKNALYMRKQCAGDILQEKRQKEIIYFLRFV